MFKLCQKIENFHYIYVSVDIYEDKKINTKVFVFSIQILQPFYILYTYDNNIYMYISGLSSLSPTVCVKSQMFMPCEFFYLFLFISNSQFDIFFGKERIALSLRICLSFSTLPWYCFYNIGQNIDATMGYTISKHFNRTW